MNKIFGTPPEPVFNHATVGVGPDILQEWLKQLSVINTTRVQKAGSFQASILWVRFNFF